VATCVGNELHEIGVRMVADFFEMEGWDTYYLGANSPTKSIVNTIEEQKADILAISVTITMNVSQVTDMIEQVRESEAGQDIKIIVGGYPFNVAPDLWREVGADGYARDAQEAISVANDLLTNSDVTR
jgi:methanogenic corrinoid protein MtbC1